MFGCNNDHRFSEKYMVKDHTSFFRGTFLLDPRHLATCTRLLSLKETKMLKFAQIILNWENQLTVILIPRSF